VAIVVMHCDLRPPDAIAFALNIFLGSKSELQTNPMLLHLESLWGATLLPHRSCAMDWDGTK